VASLALLLGAYGSMAAAKTHAARAAVKPGAGVIVDGIFEEPDNLNPAQGPDMTFSDIVETALFRNLFMVTPQDKLVPEFATEVPTLQNGGISKNGLVYTIHLRHDVKWSNGQPFTVQDIIATWHLIMSPGFVAASQVGWSDVQNIKMIDPYDFQVILKKPFPALLVDIFSGNLPGIVPASVFAHLTGKQAQNAPFNHDPTVTDGPFMFKSWVPGASITVVPNPYWFGPKPKAKEIVFEVVPDQNTLLEDAKSHSINVYYFDPIEQVGQLEAIPGATVHFTVQPAWEAAYVNFRNPALRDLRVREALEMAIDRAALVTDVWKGHAQLIAADQPSVSPAYNPALKPLPFNLAKAKQLLEEAGYKPGPGGYMEKNGKILSLVYSTTAGNAWRAAEEQLILYWFKQIGVKLIIHNLPANAFFGTFVPSGHGWDLAEFEYSEGPDPVAAMQSIFTLAGGQDYGDWVNNTFTNLVNQAAVTVDPVQRQKLMRQAEAIVAQQLPALFYYSPQEIDTSINMTGYVPNPWFVDTWNCEDWATK
jgi:peptide/nickel transport system substrate-binding protein